MLSLVRREGRAVHTAEARSFETGLQRSAEFPEAAPQGARALRCRRRVLLGHKHRIDQVDGGVCRLDAAADDAGAVNHQGILASGDGDGTTLDRGVGAGNLVRTDLSRPHVVGQDLAQEGAGIGG